MSSPIRIVLVEDNKVFREALELLLGLRSDVEVVASVEDGYAAVGAAREHEPEVLVLDYRMPGLDGIQTAHAVREASPRTAVVCLTASATPQEIAALYEAGVVACLTKDQELEEIVAAIQKAAGRLAPAE